MGKSKNLLKKGGETIVTAVAWILLKSGIERLYSCYGHFKNLVSSEIVRMKLHTPHHVSLVPPFRIIGYSHVKLNGRFSALSDLRIECISRQNGTSYSPHLEIGELVTFGQRCHIGCTNSIYIGNRVLFGSNILITDHSHGTADETLLRPTMRPLVSKGAVAIGDNTWIGDNVCILPDVTIGSNCIVGAGTIVNKDLPDNCIAVGNPVRIVRRDRGSGNEA